MKLKFSFSPRETDEFNGAQDVFFLYIYKSIVNNEYPEKINDYSVLSSNEEGLLFMNYTVEGDYKSPMGVSSAAAKAYSKISIYRREIWNGGGETISKPVVLEAGAPVFYDYGISNNRIYEYSLLPASQLLNTVVKQAIKTNWGFWSLTEIHPVKGKINTYTASPSDVWIFKYNFESGEQTQNILKTKQDNLSLYPKVITGSTNYISGDVKCLMGSEIVPYEFLSTIAEPRYNNNGNLEWEEVPKPHINGGYIERLMYGIRLTSNEKIDMLNAWRKLCFSSNPKLLKDMKGQKFLVQILSSSNTPNQNWRGIPDSISFSWAEIGDAENITVTNDYYTENSV